MADDLRATLLDTPVNRLAYTIVNEPFRYRFNMVAYGIGIIVFLVADKEAGVIRRVALSRTELAEGTVRMSQKKFEDIEIPLDHERNVIAQAIRQNEPQFTEDWRFLFTPALSPGQARMNQAGGAIACSFVYPLEFDEAGGALIFSYYKYLDKVGSTERDFMEAYSKMVSETLNKNKCTPRSFEKFN